MLEESRLGRESWQVGAPAEIVERPIVAGADLPSAAVLFTSGP